MTTADLKNFIKEHVDRSDFAELYYQYIDKLGEKNLPVIFEIDHLAALVGIEVVHIARMTNVPSFYYRKFSIPKVRGGEREIVAPLPSLLSVQRWILKNILEKIEIDEAAHGFISGKSIITNSFEHLNARALLKCDIKNFFPSIGIARVVATFESFGYSPTVSAHLAKLCTFLEYLPQGAATSPSLSNIVVRRMDHRLRRLAQKTNLNYTRYADDMSFSGNHINLGFAKIVEKIVQDEGFNLNQSKTRLIKGNRRKIIAGISVSGQVPMLPKSTKREIRRDVHLLLANGVMKQSLREGVFDLQHVDRIVGKLSFWRSVEPNNSFVLAKWNELRALQLEPFAN